MARTVRKLTLLQVAESCEHPTGGVQIIMDEVAMSLLIKVLFAAKAKSTHHKIALDALRRLTCRDAVSWQEVFLRYHDPYLVGAKAPDDQFKDFKNHVLHVKDGFWGGAPVTAWQWYGKTVTAMRDQNWVDAAYCAGVLSHYVTDPVMPLHTGQSEAEGPVHRPAEWSIAKSYEVLRDILVKELGGYPTVTVPDSQDWLGDIIRAAAVVAHGSYESLIDRYNMSLGVDHPPAGLDRELQERMARLIGLATELFAQVLSRAIAESHQPAPPVDLTLDTLVASLNMPIHWITKKISDVKDRMQVEAMYREFQQTGKVIERLPEDDKLVRELHASEVLGVATHTLDAQPIRRIGALHGAPVARTVSPSSPEVVEPIIRNPQKVVIRRPTASLPSVTQMPSTTAEPPRAPTIPLVPPRQEPPALALGTVTTTRLSQADRTSQRVPLPIPLKADIPAPEPVDLPSFVAVAKPSEPHLKSAPVAIGNLTTNDFTADSIFADDLQLAAPPPRVVFAGVDEQICRPAFQTGRNEPARFEKPSYENTELFSPTSSPTNVEPQVIAPKERLERPQQFAVRAESLATHAKSEETPRYYLDRDRPVVDAPSIGPKTAERLQNIGIETVENLLDCDPEAVATQLDVRHISANTIREWQSQAQLVCDIAGLRGHDAQILVACAIKDRDTLSAQNPATLLDRVETFLATTEGERVLRGATRPDLAEVTDWIQSARRWPKRQAA